MFIFVAVYVLQNSDDLKEKQLTILNFRATTNSYQASLFEENANLAVTKIWSALAVSTSVVIYQH